MIKDLRSFDICWILLSVVLGAWLALSPPVILQKAEREIYDLQNEHALRRQSRERLILISGGERSLQALPQWPWPRSRHAALLDRLSGAKLVLLDILFNEASNPAEDAPLIESVRRHGRVIGSAYIAPTRAGGVPMEPFPELAQSFAGLGAVNANRDVDSVYRQGLWGARLPNGNIYPSLALAALGHLLGSPGIETTAESGNAFGAVPWKQVELAQHEGGLLGFLLQHPDELEVPSYEYIDVLDGTVPPAVFDDAVVLVCFSAAGIDDTATISGNRTIAGGRFILNTLYTLLGDYAPRTLKRWQLASIAALFALFASRLGFARPRLSFPVIVAAGCAWGLLAMLLFRNRFLVLPVATPLVVGLASYVAASLLYMWRVHREWSVRFLPIDSLLVLSSQEDAVSDMDFTAYIEKTWGDVERRTGVSLESPRLDVNAPTVRGYLETAGYDTPKIGRDPLILRNAAERPPRHRMLIELPRADGADADEYTVLAWDGRGNLDILRSLAALVLSSAAHYRALEQSRRQKKFFFSTIQAMAGAIDAKDPITAGHSERVAELSRDIAAWMGLPPDAVEAVYFAATIHDIGKIGVPDTILNKPGRLDEEEFRQMQSHPIVGALIMEPVSLGRFIMDGILEHHERMDGTGYPGNVRGDGISICARIIKVADVYDALASKRQYKDPWPLAEILDYMWEQRNREFDTDVVRVFLAHQAPSNWLPKAGAEEYLGK